MIDIVAPNASGLSHNQFLDYNVGNPGVVLNNAEQAGNKQEHGNHRKIKPHPGNGKKLHVAITQHRAVAQRAIAVMQREREPGKQQKPP